MKRILWLALVAGALALFFLYGRERLPEFLTWVQGLGWRGPLLIGLLYVGATVLMIPGSLLTLGVGFLYGPWKGTLLVSPASVAGATLAFFLGRTLLRESVERRIQDSRRLQALDRALAEGGLRIVFLTRLSPVFPFVLLNYAFGLTRVSARAYLLGSFLGMLPGTFLYVYLGSTLEDLSELASGAAPETEGLLWWKWAGLAATLAVTVLVTRMARRALREAAPEVVAGEAEPPVREGVSS